MVKLSLNDACDIAKSRNGICLSTVYNNSITPMIWKCHQGHQWLAPFHRIKHAKKWCPQCASNRRCSIEEAKQIAHNRNGKCLSEKYINSYTPLSWQCAMGHKWSTSLAHIKHYSSWCPDCAHNRRLTLEEAKQIAHSRNGECLSKIFVNTRSPLLWKCAKGHEWYSTLKSIKNNNTWCPFCQNKREKLLS